jgi:hypothetical protein
MPRVNLRALQRRAQRLGDALPSRQIVRRGQCETVFRVPENDG